MSDKLVNTIGQNLVAIGLYTVAFESMVLSFRAQMYGHLQRTAAAEAEHFVNKHCGTADQTFKYCTPKLLSRGVLSEHDAQALNDVRKRRNHFAHAGYNEMLVLKVKDVDADVVLMHKITSKMERWHQEVRPDNPDGSRSFKISPAIFSLYRQAAIELAATKLFAEDVPDNSSKPTLIRGVD